MRASLEVATAMILEVRFGWRVKAIGAMVTSTFLSGVVAANFYRQTKGTTWHLPDIVWLKLGTLSTLALTLLLFGEVGDILRLSDVGRAWLLLTADFMIFGSTSF